MDKAVTGVAVAAGSPRPRPVTTTKPGFTGFSALDHSQQRFARDGDQSSLEPPDQGLCAYHGTVMEAVNDAVAVYTDRGVTVLPATALSSVFGLAPGIDRSHTPVTFGPFLSDPKCYYDPQVKRWFLTTLEIDTNPFTGAFGSRSAVYIAVSATSDPTGAYGLFSIDTTDDGNGGTPRHAHCPCLGDQPLIGADAHGFLVTTNEFSLSLALPNSDTQVYALSKRALAAAAAGGAAPVGVVQLGAGHLAGQPSQSLQPATTPPGGSYAPNHEYFLSANDFSGVSGAHSIAIWALAGTASLDTAHPALALTHKILPSEPYAGPPSARQRYGPRPLGESLGAPLPLVSSNDDRMNQVVYSGGRLYGALNAGVGSGSTKRVAAAWFQVAPSFSAGHVGGYVARQGYVAAPGANSVLFPSIALTAAGRGEMTFSLVGPQYFPSMAYVDFTTHGPQGAIRIGGAGARPEDGFTCYKAYTGTKDPCRWGDYSAAVAENSSTVVMAAEYIPNSARTLLANWGTFIGSRRS